MKKAFVTLTALGACGLAMAQSSVTVYGTADGGIGRVTAPILTGESVDGVPVQATDPVSGCLLWDRHVRLVSGSMMNNGFSRLGLTGHEDVGSGNWVGFQFETGLRLEDGSALTGQEWGGFWGRHANVFMYGDWGTLKLGRQPTVTYLAEGAYELTGQANYSVVRNTFSNNGFVSRANSAISYTTPSLGGFQAAAAFISKNNNPPDGVRVGGKNVWDVGAWYTNGALGVGASVDSGLAGGKRNYHVGAKYGFGNFALAASYHSGVGDGLGRPDDGQVAGMAIGRSVGRGLVRRGYSLGGQARFGALTVTLDVARDTRNEWSGQWSWDTAAAGWSWAPKKYTNAVLEGKYALSKRTFLYGAFLRLDGSNNWGLGLSHSF